MNQNKAPKADALRAMREAQFKQDEKNAAVDAKTKKPRPAVKPGRKKA